MAGKPYTLNFSDFNRGLQEIMKNTWPDLAQKGLFLAGALLIKDAITEKPMAPHLTGHLWRSQLILPTERMGVFIGVDVGFNVPYAAKLHEAPSGAGWTLKGSGPKYISAKMPKGKARYFKTVADFIYANGATV